MPTSPFQSLGHPLDPLTVAEVTIATQAVQKQVVLADNEIRFKLVDLAEPPKDVTLQYLHHNGPAPQRRARVYYHTKTSKALLIAIINLSDKRVEKLYDAPDSQGPVDWHEYELVTNACNNHPEVQAEIAKLKLPPK
jgi:primary-amine oxidase